MPNEYKIYAWYFPAILLIIPIHFLLKIYNVDINKILSISNEINFQWGDVTIPITLVLWLFFAHLIRFFGKHCVENTIFDNGKKFPTTTFLTEHGKELSSTLKEKILKLVQSDFNLDTLKIKSLSGEDELIEARDYVSQIRRKVNKGTLTFEHLTRYGQIRNFIGGLYVILPILFVNAIYIIYNKDFGLIQNTLLTITILYTFIFILKKTIIIKFANEYAHMLFSDYINLERNK